MVTKKVADPVAPVRDDIPANPLIRDDPADTLENVKSVLVFVRDWNMRTSAFAESDNLDMGLELILSMVTGAVEHAGASVAKGAA